MNLERLYLDIKANLSQDVLFMQNVVDGSVYPVCSQTYIKEEYKEFVCNHDDNILERYLADSEISPADYWNTIIDLVFIVRMLKSTVIKEDTVAIITKAPAKSKAIFLTENLS